jgi:aspartate racemase
MLQAEIEQASGRKVLSMIETTLGELRKRQWHRVGVLGLGEPRIYTAPLDAMGLAFETLDAGERPALDAAIFRVMEGRDTAEDAATARAAVADLRARGVQGVILGCTEIPLLLGAEADEAADLINPAHLLAEAAVQAAIA